MNRKNVSSSGVQAFTHLRADVRLDDLVADVFDQELEQADEA